MSKKSRQSASAQPIAKLVFLMFVALTVLVGGLYLFNRGGETTGKPISDPAVRPVDTGSAAKAAAEPLPKVNEAFDTLLGRWLREDGGYVIEIREVMEDGTLQAAYFNPNPIHVSRAAAAEQSGSIKVGIELNDVNYPGCLYTLIFNPTLDQLQGQYFQAGSGQTFDITFVRITGQ